jgi:hypothetical protein
VLACRLGPLPQWHLQGVHASGRRQLIGIALAALQQLLSDIPAQVSRLSSEEGAAVTAMVFACLACACSRRCFGYVSSQLLEGVQAAQRRLDACQRSAAARTSGSLAPDGAIALWLQSHSSALLAQPIPPLRGAVGSEQRSASASGSPEAAPAEESKLVVHATLLNCLAAHRQRAASNNDVRVVNAAFAQLVRYLPALLQDMALSAAEAATAAYMADVRNGEDISPRTYCAQNQTDMAGVRNGEDSSRAHSSAFCETIAPAAAALSPGSGTGTATAVDGWRHNSELHSERGSARGQDRAEQTGWHAPVADAWSAGAGQPRARRPGSGASGPSSQGGSELGSMSDAGGHLARGHAPATARSGRPGDAAHAMPGPKSEPERTPRPGPADLMGATVAPAYLDPRLSSTRMLERFRNHVAIRALLRGGYGEVLDMYEDRCALHCLRRCLVLSVVAALRCVLMRCSLRCHSQQSAKWLAGCVQHGA